MKRFFIILMCFVCITAKAQNYITNLDDTALLGTWNVVGQLGNFKFDYEYDGKAAKSIQFSDGNYTTITFVDGINTTNCTFKGYWISTAQTDKYFLHLAPWNSAQSIINFRIVSFDNGAMTLTTYDNNGTLYLEKDNAAAIRSTKTDNVIKGKTYTLNGTQLPSGDDAKGVIIQNGKKVIK